MTDALTPEQIELLRSLAEKPRLVIEDSDYFYGADYLNVCGYVDIADAPDGGFQYVVSYAGKVLLSTLEQMTCDQFWRCPKCGVGMAAGHPAILKPPTCQMGHTPTEMEQATADAAADLNDPVGEQS